MLDPARLEKLLAQLLERSAGIDAKHKRNIVTMRAERTAADGRIQVLAVIGPTPGRVWRRLRMEAEVALDFRPCPDGAVR